MVAKINRGVSLYGAIVYNPVSYTHLDVYKRQCMFRAVCSNFLRISAESSMKRYWFNTWLQVSRMPIGAAKDSRQSVSYTHLDVYKRQEFRIGHDLIRIGIEIAPDTVNPNPLAHVYITYISTFTTLSDNQFIGFPTHEIIQPETLQSKFRTAFTTDFL